MRCAHHHNMDAPSVFIAFPRVLFAFPYFFMCASDLQIPSELWTKMGVSQNNQVGLKLNMFALDLSVFSNLSVVKVPETWSVGAARSFLRPENGSPRETFCNKIN